MVLYVVCEMCVVWLISGLFFFLDGWIDFMFGGFCGFLGIFVFWWVLCELFVDGVVLDELRDFIVGERSCCVCDVWWYSELIW